MVQLTRGIGKQIQVGISRETTRGTASAVATFWLAADDWTHDEKWKNAQDVQTYGVIEAEQSETRVKQWSEGSLKVPLSASSSGLLLLSLLGTDTVITKSGESAVYQHQFTVAQNIQHPSLTLFMHDPIATPSGATADYVYPLTVVHKVEIDYSLGKFVELTVTQKAQSGSSVGTAFAPAQVVETRFVPQYLTFKSAANIASLGAASPIKLKSAKISFDTNETDDDVLGSKGPRDFLNQEFKVEGTVEAIWQNETDFKTNALTNTPQAMRFDLINTDVTIGNSSNPELVFDLAKVYFTEFSKPIKLKDVMYQTLKFNAAYSPSDGCMVRGTLTNTIATY